MFKIFEEKEKDSSVFLKLVFEGGRIRLAVVNKDGSVIGGGYLLDFNDDGTFYRNFCVSPTLGVQVVNGKFVERT